jgi:lipoate-protein ligase A
LLETEIRNAFENMAVDESIFQARIRNLAPNTIRFYMWNPSAVSIGRFQEVEKEVHTENCKLYGVDIVRRITGGGTVYHDKHDEITYSVVSKTDDLGTDDVSQIFNKIYSGLVEAVQRLGVVADFNRGDEKACPNLTINGKKISGSAQAYRKGVVLQHGTLLLEVNLKKMFTFLRVPWAESLTQIIDVAQHKITSLEEQLHKKTNRNVVTEALIAGFEKELNIHLERGKLTRFEKELSDKFYAEKYQTDEWNKQGKSQP